MPDSRDYTFKIKDSTPDTMPFGRLLAYYAEIKKMIGMAEHMHLIEIIRGSHESGFAIDLQYQSSVAERFAQIAEGTAPKPSMRARDAINQMLREDGTSGEFYAKAGDNVIQFPGRLTDQNVLYSIRDTATFIGELYHIAGGKDDVRIRISTDTYGVVFCKTSREIGKGLREFLFEEVKITGRGVWKRLTDGTWAVNDVTITDFAPRSNDSLKATVKRLHNLNISWPDDTISLIEDIEEKGNQIH